MSDDRWDEVPENKVLVSPKNNSPSSNAVYHTTVCYAVRDHYITRSEEWADRSRLEECKVCDSDGPGTGQKSGYRSLARKIRRQHNS